jgi:hypothetical protein
MSTEYVCFNNGKSYVSLLEHSGKLDLSVDDGLGNGVDINDLTPDQVARMAIKMLLAAHYQDEEAVANAARESRERYAMRISL